MTTRGTANPAVAAAAERVNRAHEELAAARKELRQALEARDALPGNQPTVCGSLAGARTHTKNGEPICYACADARAISDRKKNKR